MPKRKSESPSTSGRSNAFSTDIPPLAVAPRNRHNCGVITIFHRGARRPPFRRLAVVGFWFFLIALCADWFPWLRGYKPWPPEWQWPHKIGDAPLAAALLVALGLGAIAGARALAGRLRARPRRATLAAMLIGLYALLSSLQFTSAFTRSPRLTFLFAQRTYVDWLNSFFLASLQTEGFRAVWADYDLLDEKRFPRVVTHPPGFIVYYTAVRQAIEAVAKRDPAETLPGEEARTERKSGARSLRRAVDPLEAARVLKDDELRALVYSAYLQPLLANLALIPLFDLFRRHYSARVAIRIGLLYCLIPAVVLFVPSPDEFFLPLAATALWGFSLGCGVRLFPRTIREKETHEANENNPARAITDKDSSNCAGNHTSPPRAFVFPPRLYLGLAGAAVGIHSLFGYHFTVLLFIFVFWRILLTWRDTALGFRPAQALRRLVMDLAAFAAPIAALWLLVDLALGFNYVEHWIGGTGLHRFGITRYRSYWGWAIWNLWDVALFLGLPLLAAIAWGVWKHRLLLSPYAIALVAALLAVDLSGAVRGETARILLLFYPLLIPLAAPFLDGPDGSRRFRLVALHLLAQLTCMALYLHLM